jgi:ABC-type multidrug transport system ATPase subunit
VAPPPPPSYEQPPYTPPVQPPAPYPVAGQLGTPQPVAIPVGGTRRVDPGVRLEIRISGQKDVTYPLGPYAISVGREPENAIVASMPFVSRHHARIEPCAGGYAVEDLGSANGTYLKGRKIPPNQVTPLTHGDVIRIGDQEGNSISLTYLETEPQITHLGKLDLGQAQLGNLARFNIGRDPTSNLWINSPVVSWHHAEVIRTSQGHQINDLGSTNGTFVNGQKVRSYLLKAGDEVHIGPYQLVYSASGFQQLSTAGSVRLDSLQLRKEVKTQKGKKILLNNISLTVMPREFIALVGGSGAGKSTLMDALNGFRRAQSGVVMVNGDDFYRNYDAYRTNMGYVPQSDILHTGLSVRKALQYTARLRLPPDTSKQAIAHRIEEALKQVEMLPQIDQTINSLSGGQRKRVSIAAELLSDPSLFYLDEPTSGLDPGLDKKMMRTLRLLADNGRTIVLTTHATNNIFGQCDQVAFLSFGRLVYYGPPEQAIAFFGANDFSDIYSKLDSPETAAQWEAQYKASNEYRQYVQERQSNLQEQARQARQARKAVTRGLHIRATLQQFFILTRRYFDLIVNDKLSLFILLLVLPLIGMLFIPIANAKSLVGDTTTKINEIIAKDNFYQIVDSTQKVMLMMALTTFLLGLFAAGYEIIKEKTIYRRERMVNLGIFPYLGSKMFVLMGFGVVQIVAFMVAIGLKVDYPSDGVMMNALLEIFITLVLVLMVGLGMGLLISAIVQNSNMVVYIILVLIMFQFIYSGVMFELPKLYEPLSYVAPTRWAIQAMGATVDIENLNKLGQQYIDQINGMPIHKSVPAPFKLFLEFKATQEALLFSWGMLLLLWAVSALLTATVLRMQDVQT